MLVFRILSILLFFFCILVQLNDPDPWVWMILYSIPIFWTIFPPDNQLARRLVGFNALIYLIAGIWLFPSEFHGLSEMKDGVPEIEEAREALGLVIASVGIFVTTWFVKEEKIGRTLERKAQRGAIQGKSKRSARKRSLK